MSRPLLLKLAEVVINLVKLTVVRVWEQWTREKTYRNDSNKQYVRARFSLFARCPPSTDRPRNENMRKCLCNLLLYFIVGHKKFYTRFTCTWGGGGGDGATINPCLMMTKSQNHRKNLIEMGLIKSRTLWWHTDTNTFRNFEPLCIVSNWLTEYITTHVSRAA